ncbi:melanoregulin-like isoform X2 [Eucyclogobius newberryi]|uniref:melanoregulin-like isoform X2 n=1 Tax=Eucyclogobius newberryi TaxID=166745 RepID=UPI003B5CAC26
MGAGLTLCCCRFYLRHSREEKNAILRSSSMQTTTSTTAPRLAELQSSESTDSDPEEEGIFGPQSPRRNPSNKPHQQQKQQPGHRSSVEVWSSHKTRSGAAKRRSSERELQAFISMRDQADKATEEWEQLNFDIHTLRYAKREVRARWEKILLQLGYQCEVEALLNVNKQTHFSRDQEHLSKAIELLKYLLEHTCLFPPGTGHHSRYLYVMDRLVSLDSAEDFVRLAKEKYPKRDG